MYASGFELNLCEFGPSIFHHSTIRDFCIIYEKNLEYLKSRDYDIVYLPDNNTTIRLNYINQIIWNLKEKYQLKSSKMRKRTIIKEFKSDSEFKFWVIVISWFVWGYSLATVAIRFNCSEAFVIKVRQKFDEDGGYVDNHWYNAGHQSLLYQPKQNKKIMKWRGISRKGKIPLYFYRLDTTAGKNFHSKDQIWIWSINLFGNSIV